MSLSCLASHGKIIFKSRKLCLPGRKRNYLLEIPLGKVADDPDHQKMLHLHVRHRFISISRTTLLSNRALSLLEISLTLRPPVVRPSFRPIAPPAARFLTPRDRPLPQMNCTCFPQRLKDTRWHDIGHRIERERSTPSECTNLSETSGIFHFHSHGASMTLNLPLCIL